MKYLTNITAATAAVDRKGTLAADLLTHWIMTHMMIISNLCD
jgi:hypothetical protein